MNMCDNVINVLCMLTSRNWATIITSVFRISGTEYCVGSRVGQLEEDTATVWARGDAKQDQVAMEKQNTNYSSGYYVVNGIEYLLCSHIG